MSFATRSSPSRTANASSPSQLKHVSSTHHHHNHHHHHHHHYHHHHHHQTTRARPIILIKRRQHLFSPSPSWSSSHHAHASHAHTPIAHITSYVQRSGGAQPLAVTSNSCTSRQNFAVLGSWMTETRT
eukprot:2914023-Rhodomonas_salina.2